MIDPRLILVRNATAIICKYIQQESNRHWLTLFQEKAGIVIPHDDVEPLWEELGAYETFTNWEDFGYSLWDIRNHLLIIDYIQQPGKDNWKVLIKSNENIRDGKIRHFINEMITHKGFASDFSIDAMRRMIVGVHAHWIDEL